MHKDGTAIHPSLMAAADDEKKAGEVGWIIDQFWDLQINIKSASLINYSLGIFHNKPFHDNFGTGFQLSRHDTQHKRMSQNNCPWPLFSMSTSKGYLRWAHFKIDLKKLHLGLTEIHKLREHSWSFNKLLLPISVVVILLTAPCDLCDYCKTLFIREDFIFA